jgi:glutaredoxin
MIRSAHDYIKYSFWCKKEFEEILDEQIKNSEVVIVGLSFCPWTLRAKTLIKNFYKKDSTMIISDVIGNEYKVNLLYCMCKKTNTTNVPQIWLKGKHIGGYEQLWKMHHRHKINL